MPAPIIPAAGVTPLSYFLGTAAVAPGDIVAILADAIDPQTGEYLSIERGFDPTDAAMLTAFRTKRGTGSAVENVGQRFSDAKKIDQHLDTFMSEEVRIAAKDIVDAGDATITSVQTVVVDSTSVETYVTWENVARQKAQNARLPVGGLVGSAP